METRQPEADTKNACATGARRQSAYEPQYADMWIMARDRKIPAFMDQNNQPDRGAFCAAFVYLFDEIQGETGGHHAKDLVWDDFQRWLAEERMWKKYCKSSTALASVQAPANRSQSNPWGMGVFVG